MRYSLLIAMGLACAASVAGSGPSRADEEGPGWANCDTDKPVAVYIKGCTLAYKLSTKPDDKALALSWRSKGYQAKHQYTEAIADIGEALAIAPSVYYLMQRGEIYRDAKKYDLALADMDAAIGKAPAYGFLIERAETQEAAGHIDKAIADYETALRKGGTLDSIMAEARAKMDRLKAKQAH